MMEFLDLREGKDLPDMTEFPDLRDCKDLLD